MATKKGSLKHRQTIEIANHAKPLVNALREVWAEVEKIQSEAYDFERSVEGTAAQEFADQIWQIAEAALKSCQKLDKNLQELAALADD